MTLPPISFSAVLLAALAMFVFNFIYFGPKTMFPVWWKALGKGENDKPGVGVNMGVVFGITILSTLLQALFLGVVMGALFPHPRGVDGALAGSLLGLFLCALPSLGHRLFAGQGFKVWAIEAAADIGTFALAGWVLGVMSAS
jgi:hypothetical protein